MHCYFDQLPITHDTYVHIHTYFWQYTSREWKLSSSIFKPLLVYVCIRTLMSQSNWKLLSFIESFSLCSCLASNKTVLVCCHFSHRVSVAVDVCFQQKDYKKHCLQIHSQIYRTYLILRCDEALFGDSQFELFSGPFLVTQIINLFWIE